MEKKEKGISTKTLFSLVILVLLLSVISSLLIIMHTQGDKDTNATPLGIVENTESNSGKLTLEVVKSPEPTGSTESNTEVI